MSATESETPPKLSRNFQLSTFDHARNYTLASTFGCIADRTEVGDKESTPFSQYPGLVEDSPLRVLGSGSPGELNPNGRTESLAAELLDTFDAVHAPTSQASSNPGQGFSSTRPDTSSRLFNRELGATDFPSQPLGAAQQGVPQIPRAKQGAISQASWAPEFEFQSPETAFKGDTQDLEGLKDAGDQTSTSDTTPTTNGPSPHDEQPKNLYAKSNFDMLRALSYVVGRKNPEVHLGAVDMSCSFVVCDIMQNDCPIIYVSDNFQNLTGYSRHEIVGNNCRFLQAPNGKVEMGSRREFVDNNSVYDIKKRLAAGREVQLTLLNYRKGGMPFENMLTMIPIPWDTDEIRYYIGFQMDATECPDMIPSQGGNKVDYVNSNVDQYIWEPPPSNQWEPTNSRTLPIEDVSTLLQHYIHGTRIPDWIRPTWHTMLVENTDDVVHILTPKGIFAYLSPSCRDILEWDSADLEGRDLDSICHPSDRVPVLRELKQANCGQTVNFIFRIRRKNSGYTWFECRGALLPNQRSRKKFIALTGRKLPAPTLQRRDFEANGGVGNSEIWTKVSASGLFLFVPYNVQSLLGYTTEDLEGTSIWNLMSRESRFEFGRSMEKARGGKITTCKHDIKNKKGRSLQAKTTLYPGDAVGVSKASFLLIQTRLIGATPGSVGYDPLGTNPPQDNPLGTMGVGDNNNDYRDNNHRISSNSSSSNSNIKNTPGLDDDIFGEFKTTKCSSWQFELRQMDKDNRLMAEDVERLLSKRKKRKRRKAGAGVTLECANCHTRDTSE